MKFKIIATLAFLFGLALWSFRPAETKPVLREQQKSPLALANELIPELMGKKDTSSMVGVNTAEVLRENEKAQFRNYLETSYVRLPTLQAISLSKNGDLHRVPPEVLESSEVFGYIAEKLKSNPSLTRDALSFYNACAANEQLITSIRAVCARNLIDWAKKAQIDISQVHIPEKILQIVVVLPERN